MCFKFTWNYATEQMQETAERFLQYLIPYKGYRERLQYLITMTNIAAPIAYNGQRGEELKTNVFLP